jgi:hypothetical protein
MRPVAPSAGRAASGARDTETMESAMKTKTLSIAVAAGLLIGAGEIVQAQTRGNPGASGVSPGHEMQEHGGERGPGASGFAPGHAGDRDDRLRGDDEDRTTGFGGRDPDDRLRGDRDDQMMDNDTRGIDKE